MVTSLSIGSTGMGRFANQMWIIAGCIGIARRNNMDFAFPKWINKENELFGMPCDDLTEHFINGLPEIPDGVNWNMYEDFWGYRDVVLDGGNWSIDSYLQSPKFFKHCLDEVRHYFRMKKEGEVRNLCAIHVRGGDYSSDENEFHIRLSKDYYSRAISIMPKTTNFVVFTDDIDFSKKVTNLNCAYLSRNYLDDFKMMKRCKHFIIANSSYSSMAAVLSDHRDKIVVAPKKWFGLSADISPDDIYDNGWIIT